MTQKLLQTLKVAVLLPTIALVRWQARCDPHLWRHWDVTAWQLEADALYVAGLCHRYRGVDRVCRLGLVAPALVVGRKQIKPRTNYDQN
jgi:hypothetical protein